MPPKAHWPGLQERIAERMRALGYVNRKDKPDVIRFCRERGELTNYVYKWLDGSAVPVNPRLVITLYPGGVIGLREARRRREYTIEAGALYGRLVVAEAKCVIAERKRGAR